MKRFISTVLLAVFCISVCACQPTPDKQFVVNKGDGKLLEIIDGEPAPALAEPYHAPESWTEIIEGRIEDRLTVEVEACVTVPDVLEYPVYEAVYSDYSQEDFENFLNNTVGDVDLYVTRTYDTPQTYTDALTGEAYREIHQYEYVNTREAQLYIDAIEYQLNEKNSPFNRYHIPGCIKDGELYGEEYGKNEQKQSVKNLLEMENAYEHILNHQSDFMTKVNKTYNTIFKDKWVFWYTENGNSKIFINRKPHEMNTLSYEPDGYSKSPTVPDVYTRAIRDNLNCGSMDVNSAQALADAWLEKLNLDSWTHVNTGSAEEETIENQLKIDVYIYGFPGAIEEGTWADYDFYGTSLYKTAPDAYLFTYAPTQSGIPVLYFANKQNNDYSNHDWYMPYLQIAVGENGVRSVKLVNGSSGFGECLNTNVPLLPFEEIQQKFRDYIVMNTDFTGQISSEGVSTERDYDNHEMTRIHIDDIRLGYIKIKRINSSDYMTVPAWCFYGQEYNRFTEDNQDFILDENNECYVRTLAGHSFLCINAIDGSIIDLTKGY